MTEVQAPHPDFEDEGDDNASTSPDVVEDQNPEGAPIPEPDLAEDEVQTDDLDLDNEEDDE